MHYLDLRDRAREMRKNSTVFESMLWQYLRGKKLDGYKFLRQHPIVYQVDGRECFFYIADFYCHRQCLVVELDGGIHDEVLQREKDRKRDEIISSLGLNVLRIRNEELTNMPAVLAKISKALHAHQNTK